jgi:hypothetical protein
LNQIFRISLASTDASQPALEIGAQVKGQASKELSVRLSIPVKPGQHQRTQLRLE